MDHILSVCLPPPSSVTVSINTFIRFELRPEEGEKVGVVEGITTSASQLAVRRFLSIDEIREFLPPGNSVLDEITLWPSNTSSPPFYLCDSDLRVDVGFSSVRGYAFVFFDTDSVVDQLCGMGNTYLVTSLFLLSSMTVRHGRTFNSFPSECYPHLLQTCHASNLWYKLLLLKRKIQERMNTRGMSNRNRQVVLFENFDLNAWQYILKLCPVDVASALVVVKGVYMKADECNIEKHREYQHSFALTLPNHLPYAKLLLGSSVGVGIRCILHCKIGKQQHALTRHAIQDWEQVNFIPFEEDSEELTRRGFEFKYIPRRMLLTVTIRYRMLKTAEEVRNAFATRLPTENNIIDNTWPLHYATTVFGSHVASINLSNRMVILTNGEHHSVQECIQNLEATYT